jgi:hypothetical protein
LLQTGSANNNSISVAGLAFVCAGHVAHHMRIIRERYLGEESPQKAKGKTGKKKKKKAGTQR